MDNSDATVLHQVDGDGELYELLPREEALARLYELRNRHGQLAAHRFASNVCEQHRRDHGHLLRQGCCAEQLDAEQLDELLAS